ncbi:Integrase core domain-containing protein [Vibrio gazogenes DSM 21264]|uniref:Integrase core domain-containing protein n=1 Tax=Vibrio gazogenes DSM 21264 = NBRC 103151 TaxID=1123492 RepID=A0A1M4YUD0_VIBGA|nr:Integrase core domain-containing protein [Vibrio gazogenes DSM 21264] [Vibrio gazogenes DSM 21264 = NBRC 103151]
MERLFRSLKSEWIPEMGYSSVREAKQNISYYLMDYYNWQRPHQHNDGVPPALPRIGLGACPVLVDLYKNRNDT